MNTAKFRVNNFDFSFTDADVCNLNDWIPEGESNPHRVRPWLLHDHGFTLAVVFSDCLNDAIDTAVDEGKLEGFEISEEELKDYDKEDERIEYLGNYGKPHDIGTLGYVELRNPRASFAAQFQLQVEVDGA